LVLLSPFSYVYPHHRALHSFPTRRSSDLGRPEPKPSEPQVAGYSQVSPNYFQTMGIPLLRGRHFDNHDTVDAPFAAIVNESFVRDRKSTRLNSSHDQISYAVFCLKKKKKR